MNFPEVPSPSSTTNPLLEQHNTNPLISDTVQATTTQTQENNWKKWAKIAAMVVAVALVAIGVLALLTGFSILLPGAIPALAAFIVGGLTIAAGTALFVGSAYSLRNQLLAETTRPGEREEVQKFVDEQEAALNLLSSADAFNNTEYSKIRRGRRRQILREFKNELEQLSQEKNLIAVPFIDSYLNAYHPGEEIDTLDEEDRTTLVQKLNQHLSTFRNRMI